MRIIDGIDATITKILQDNARTSNAEIARQVGLAPSAVFERIRKLEERGAIRGFRADLDPHAVGLPLLAFVFVRSNERAGGVGTAEKLSRIPEVLEVHHVAGEDCFLVKLRAADTEALGRLLRERVGTISTVTSTRTTIVLETVKESLALPLEDAGEEEPEVKRA
jgi:Lrp/AsnC family leucine-responsive transcriptional regulator